MLARLAASALAFATLATAAEKRPPAGTTSNETLEINATAYTDKDSIQRLLGSDLGGVICVIEVKLAPKGEAPLAVNLDDFMLRSDRDGQKSQPFAPSQIAGKSALVVSTSGGGGGIMMGNPTGPVWGGIPGTDGRPRQLGGDGGAIGNTDSAETTSTVRTASKEKEDPLLATLKAKVLPAKSVSEPVSGLLYFLLEGKHKPKDLELLYRGPAGKLSLRFR